MRLLHLLFAALALLPLAPPARAQAVASADSALFIVYEGTTPIANERQVVQSLGDSLVITAVNQRQLLDDKGQRYSHKKSMVLVVDARDYGLMRYESELEFQGLSAIYGLLPTDTVVTYYRERAEGGNADRVVMPPGRLFVMDAQMFTLFDVLCRSLATKQFETRRVQLLALLPDSLGIPVATVTMLRPDTLGSGTERKVVRHYALEDRSARFELWADATGRMLRMIHPESGVSVERVPDSPISAPPRRRVPVRR